jgi:hypothetical protein
MAERGFKNLLVVTPLPDGKNWVLQKNFGFVDGSEAWQDISVEAGFVTDFASIPRPFWVIYAKWGKYGRAAVVHDWLYWRQQDAHVERWQAD